MPPKKTSASLRRKARSKTSATPNRLRRRSREDILNRIVEAATEEFNRCGYVATTTAAVASKAGVTEAQLFRCYGSKANLFRETIFNPLSKHLQKFTADHMPENGIKRDSRLYTSELQEFIAEHAGAITSLIFAETYSHGSDVGVSEIDSLRTYFNRGATTMRQRLKRKPKIDPDLFVRITFVTVLGCVIFKSWIFPRGVASADQVRSAINEFIAMALASNER